MKRVAGIILFGLGVLFIVLAIGLPLYVAPAVTKLPYDLEESTSLVEAKNATFLHLSKEEGVKVKTGNLLSTTIVRPQPIRTQELQKEFKDNAVLWNVYSTTTFGDSVIAASATEIALDRVSGAPVDWNGAWYDDGTKSNKKFKGQIYKFPFHTERKDYAFWDGELGASAPAAKFEGVETFNGVEVYRFKQTIPFVKATSVAPDRISALVGNFSKTAKSGEVWYANTRTFWVEPVTGQFLNLREQRKQELRMDDGTKVTLLDADFSYSKSTVDKSVETASSNKFLINAVSIYAPIALGVLALLFIVIGLLMTRRKRDYTPGHSHGGEF